MKRWIINMLLFSMMLSMTACSDKKAENQISDGITVQENITVKKDNLKKKDTSIGETTVQNEEENEKTEEAEPGDLTEIQKEVSYAEPLQLLITEESMGEWYTDESSEDIINYEKLCDVSWQEVILGEEDAQKYPGLAEALMQINTVNRDYYTNALSDLQLWAQEMLEESEGGDYFYPFYSNSQFSVQRADDRIVSIREDFGDYTGGVHGNYGILGNNFDTQTGETLLLTDVFVQTDSLPAIIAEKVIEKYADENETFESLQGTLEKDYTLENYNWTINYQGITFYFSPYEIASYATGIIRATIWFDENPELFYAEYLERPESGFAMSVPLGYEIDVDLDPSDVGKNRLLISSYEDQEYGTYYLNVSKNDTVYEFSDYGYRFVPYLVCVGKAGKEQYYLYVESTQENDYNILYVYDLNQEEMQRTVFEGVGFSGVFYEDAGEYGTYYEYVWNDPQNFEMTTKIEILGTWSGRRFYTVNVENGLPEAYTEDYEIFSYLGTVSRIPLEVTMLSDMQTKELPAGTTFHFIRTDGESYVDAVLDDGRECRIYVEFEDWNQYINGVNQWECFEELMYAG